MSARDKRTARRNEREQWQIEERDQADSEITVISEPQVEIHVRSPEPQAEIQVRPPEPQAEIPEQQRRRNRAPSVFTA